MLERITDPNVIDSMTLDDLVKLSYLTPESRRIILHTFHACAEQEVSVKQGQKVNFIFREGDWAYVATNDKKQGFVPFNVIAKIGGSQTSTVDVENQNRYANNSLNHFGLPIHVVGRHPYITKESTVRKVSVESDETRSSTSDVINDSFASSPCSYDSGADGTSDVTVHASGVTGMAENVEHRSINNIPTLKTSHAMFSNQQSNKAKRQDSEYSTTKGIYIVLYDYKGKSRPTDRNMNIKP